MSIFASRRRRDRLLDRLAVVGALADGNWHYGLDLYRSCGLPAGRLYDALDRLTAAGAVESGWEHVNEGGAARRRLYRLPWPVESRVGP